VQSNMQNFAVQNDNGRSILRNIIILATRCQILSLKCIKFDFGFGSVKKPARARFQRPTSKEWEGTERKKGEE